MMGFVLLLNITRLILFAPPSSFASPPSDGNSTVNRILSTVCNNAISGGPRFSHFTWFSRTQVFFVAADGLLVGCLELSSDVDACGDMGAALPGALR